MYRLRSINLGYVDLLFGDGRVDAPLLLEVRLVSRDGEVDPGPEHLAQLPYPVLDLMKQDILKVECLQYGLNGKLKMF